MAFLIAVTFIKVEGDITVGRIPFEIVIVRSLGVVLVVKDKHLSSQLSIVV